jgi:hypothetical protein
MRLPWGSLNEIAATFLRDKDFAILGSLSFEERCSAVTERMFSENCRAVDFIEIADPVDAFPDYSAETKLKIELNRQRLNRLKIPFRSLVTDLLATEDQLLNILDGYEKSQVPPSIVLDITSLPKRYFCFFIKRLLLRNSFRNVVVTYTAPGPNGYAVGHLAEDPMTCDHLPGYAAPLLPKGSTLVVAVGFESLSIRSLLELFSDKRKDTKIILPFPATVGSVRREWDTLRQMFFEATDVNRNNLEVIAAWDAEQVYKTLERWNQDADGLTLAPFGPKPHSLGMALFGIKHDSGLYYTQPRSYNPDYSKGRGNSWAYVVKWSGVRCFDRAVSESRGVI